MYNLRQEIGEDITAFGQEVGLKESAKERPTLLFRADGNPKIGSGHIMRCLSIADAARKQGRRCLFVMADGHFARTVEENGHEVLVLHTDYTDMLSESGSMQELIRSSRPAALFMDSYQVSPPYLAALQKACQAENGVLVYIDDIMAFPCPCDILLNYNIYGPDQEPRYRELYRMAGIASPRLLLGTAYAPLRAEFQNLPVRKVRRQAQKILISTGGSDPEHVSLKLAQYIIKEKESFGAFSFHFVIGAMNSDREELKQLAASHPFLILHSNVSYMQPLMSACDVAISAAGSTLYELCATQTPAVTYILADNQIPGAAGFAGRQLLCCAGDIRELGEDLAGLVLREAVNLAGDYERRVQTAERQRAVVDGGGAGRILDRIFPDVSGAPENVFL